MIPKCKENKKEHQKLENKFNKQLNNGNSAFDGFYKRSIRDNTNTFSISVPTTRTDGFIRKAIVAIGDVGILFLNFIHSSNTATVTWSSFTSPSVSVSFDGSILTLDFSRTVYGGISVLFLD